MKKVIRIVRKGEDESIVIYWISLSIQERMKQLEALRQQINTAKYGNRQGFQRVYRVIKQTQF